MRKLLLSLALLTSVWASAQVTSITVEQIYTDDGTVADYPAGYSTYHIFANTTNPNDAVATVYGEVQYPLLLTISDGCIWNSFFGAEKGDDLNPLFCGVSPAACYDSFITIGRLNSQSPGGAIFLLEDAGQPFSNEFSNGQACGSSFVTNTQVGGAWFGLPGDVNLYPVDGKVLLAQITTDGCISGSFNLQVFPNFVNSGDPYIEQTDLQFSAPGCGIVAYGCTDSNAVNYDPAATEDNGSCLICDLEIANITTSTPTCSNSTNGSIVVNMQTTSDFFPKYSLNGGDLTFGSPPLTKTYSNLASGTYTLAARDTKFDDPGFNPGGIYGSCVVTTTVDFNILPVTIPASTVTNITCNGAGDGVVVNTGATGGNGNYTYNLQYSPENTPVMDDLGDPISLSSPNYSSLDPDCYRWNVVDENGCIGNSTQFCVTQPAALFAIVISTIPPSCSDSNDGQVIMTWGGGTGDVDWSANDVNGVYLDGSNIVQGLPSGPGIMYAKDLNECIDDVTFTIAATPAVSVSATFTDPTCFGGENATITGAATGGTGAFTYSLDNESFGSGNFTGLTAGEYTVYAMDANDCPGETVVTIGEPEEIEASTIPTDISCFGDNDGCIEVEINGGTAPFQINGSNLNQFCDLGPGDYTYDVVDANGCTTSTEGTVSEPSELLATTTTADVTCNNEGDGEIVIVPTGGTAPYTYSNNCGDNFQDSDTFDDLDGGTYCIVVEDDNGCQVTISTVTIQEPEELDGTITTISGVDEDGGDISLDVTGGTPNYDYSWVGPNGFTASSQDLSGLDDAGTYTVTVTDDNGCTWTESVTITSLNEFGVEYTINVSPNPTSGLFNLTIQGLSSNLVRYHVTDAQGRMVVERMLNKNQSVVAEQVDLTQFESGVYFLNLLIGDNVQTIKVIKQ